VVYRRACWLVALGVLLGCTESLIDDPADDAADDSAMGPISFELIPIQCIGTDDAMRRVFDAEEGWASFWVRYSSCTTSGEPTPPTEIDFDENVLVAVIDEGECRYSGCIGPNSMPLIDRIESVDGQAIVHTLPVDATVLGGCHACVQFQNYALVSRSDVRGLDFVFE
jgi:hypothetical protein